jgi:hypothetical protein
MKKLLWMLVSLAVVFAAIALVVPHFISSEVVKKLSLARYRSGCFRWPASRLKMSSSTGFRVAHRSPR